MIASGSTKYIPYAKKTYVKNRSLEMDQPWTWGFVSVWND